MKITNLQRLGIDTNLDQTFNLTISGDVKKDFQGVFRVLKKLTSAHAFEDVEAQTIIQALKSWRPNINLSENYKPVQMEDMGTISRIIGFSTKEMVPVHTLISGDTIMCIYDGKAFRSSHLFTGGLNRAASLPSGARMKNVFLITRQAAILLNWAQLTYGTQAEANPDWTSGYADQTDNSYFGVLAHFILSKFNAINARHHQTPLRKIFMDFYLDYLSTFSVTLQTREEDRLNQDSVARAFQTKKNIPLYVQARMESTSLNQYFDFVELDEDIDMDLLSSFEAHVDQFFALTPIRMERNVAALRLRKLGKHSSHNKTTSGLYYPQVDNISIDLRDVKSFAHEWAHAFDHGNNDLSKQVDFMSVIYPAVVAQITAIADLAPAMKAYYAMPSEVFARMFEWYMINTYDLQDNACFGSYDEYNTNPIYTAYRAVESNIQRYFTTLQGGL